MCVHTCITVNLIFACLHGSSMRESVNNTNASFLHFLGTQLFIYPLNVRISISQCMHVDGADGTEAKYDHTSPDTVKPAQAKPSSSRHGSKATSESSTVRQALKGSIFTVHDRQKRKNKSTVVPVVSGGAGREEVQTAPLVSSFISQQGSTSRAAGRTKHGDEDAAQCNSNARKSSIPVSSKARKEKLDWERNSSSQKEDTGSSVSPLRAASPVSYRVLSVSPAPESQQANLSNSSETKLEQIEKHGRIARLNFPSIVGHKQPGNGPMELWATRNPSNLTMKDREIRDAQLHHVKPLHSTEVVEGRGDGLQEEGPDGGGLSVVSAWGGGSGESASTTEGTRTAHHMLDVSGGYDKDSFEEVRAVEMQIGSTP